MCVVAVCDAGADDVVLGGRAGEGGLGDEPVPPERKGSVLNKSSPVPGVWRSRVACNTADSQHTHKR